MTMRPTPGILRRPDTQKRNNPGLNTVYVNE